MVKSSVEAENYIHITVTIISKKKFIKIPKEEKITKEKSMKKLIIKKLNTASYLTKFAVVKEQISRI